MPMRKGSREAHERSLKAAETRKRNKAAGPRVVPVTTHVPRGGSRSVKKMSLSELSGEFERLRHTPDTPDGSVGRRYYAIKDELRARAAKEQYGKTYQQIGEETIQAGRAKIKAKKHRAAEKKKNPVAHRKDLEGASRRLYEAYDRARTPGEKRKITARLKRIHSEMAKRYYDE